MQTATHFEAGNPAAQDTTERAKQPSRFRYTFLSSQRAARLLAKGRTADSLKCEGELLREPEK